MDLGKALRIARAHRDLAQADIADATKMSRGYLSQLENNKREWTAKTLEQIAAALDIPVLVLVYLASEPAELERISAELVQLLDCGVPKLLRG